MEPKPVNMPETGVNSREPNHSGSVHVGRQHRVEAERPVAVAQTNSVQPATPSQQPAPQNQAEATSAAVSSKDLILPPDLITKTHISRTLREVDKINDFFHQAAIRGSENQNLPDVSKELESLAVVNNLNILQPQDRDILKAFLTRLKTKAPVVHMSFPTEAGNMFLGKLLEWYRREAHPYTVLHIGLQPELAAGCIVRTTNKLHDFSFRKRFDKSKAKLIEALEKASQEVAAEAKLEPALATNPMINTEAPQPVANTTQEATS